jgi:uncharacterized protein (TIGR00730 family)
MKPIRSVVVFCGASEGSLPIWREAAIQLGEGLAARGIRLVYGGGRVGLMGAVADGALHAEGTVLGVIPEFLRRREVAHTDATFLEVTDTMHARKQRMADEADAFVSFAGGLGTLDETFEILTWRQLGLHHKPIFICDVAGSAKALLQLITATVEMGFAKPDIHDLYETVEGVPALLRRLDDQGSAHG